VDARLRRAHHRSPSGTWTRAIEYAIDGTPSREHRITGSTTLANLELRRGGVRIFAIEP
jgi:hypothetical protein